MVALSHPVNPPSETTAVDTLTLRACSARQGARSPQRCPSALARRDLRRWHRQARRSERVRSPPQQKVGTHFQRPSSQLAFKYLRFVCPTFGGN